MSVPVQFLAGTDVMLSSSLLPLCVVAVRVRRWRSVEWWTTSVCLSHYNILRMIVVSVSMQTSLENFGLGLGLGLAWSRRFRSR